jgi:hypothetical protein
VFELFLYLELKMELKVGLELYLDPEQHAEQDG